ncbi:MAG: hypothetical protein EBT89_08185 [Opitutaceae bacterium]|nr:hypothetical protein [Opitutaceae bacterium]
MIRHLLTAVEAGGFGLRDDGLKVTVIGDASFLLSHFPKFHLFRLCLGRSGTQFPDFLLSQFSSFPHFHLSFPVSNCARSSIG